MSVTVYGKPGCRPCKSTVAKLDEFGIEFEYVDISQAPEALDTIQSLGHMQAPVVVTDRGHWSGYNPDRIEALQEPLAA